MEIQKFRDEVALNDRLKELIEIEEILKNYNTLTITYVNGEGKYFHLDDSKTKAIQTILWEHYRAIKEDIKKQGMKLKRRLRLFNLYLYLTGLSEEQYDKLKGFGERIKVIIIKE